MPSAERAAVRDTAEFGERLRALRRARGLRQQDVADGGYSAAYVSMLESGRTRASMKALEHLAAKLGVDVAELLGGTRPGEVDARLAVARGSLQGGDALRTLDVMGSLAAESLSPRQLLSRLSLEGRAYIRLRRAKEAVAPLERALAIARQLQDKAEIARVRNELGAASGQSFAYREAVQHHLAALEAIQRGDLRDRHLELEVLRHLGESHAALGEHAVAIGYYERALAAALELADPERLAGVQMVVADAYAQQRDYEAAIAHARASVTLREQVGDERALPEVMRNLALLYATMGNRSRADELLEQAIASVSRAGPAQHMPHLLLSRAALVARTDARRSIELARRALDIAIENEQRDVILSARLFLATLEAEAMLGRAAFQECLRFARAHQPERARTVLEAWSEWESRHGDAKFAAKLAREALATG